MRAGLRAIAFMAAVLAAVHSPAASAQPWQEQRLLCAKNDAMCAVYFYGILDGLGAAQDPMVQCIPPTINKDTLYAVFKKFAADRPDLWQYETGLLVVGALAAAYHCSDR
jgi:hypothetical protein